MTAQQEQIAAAHRHTRTGIFYGWWIAVACCAITFVGAGVGVYGPAVFIKALQDEHGWSVGAISLATTCYFLAGGVSGIFVGRWLDTHGPRGLFAVTAVVMAAALLLIGRITSLWQLFPAYLLMAPAMSGLSNIPVTWLLTRWFVRRRAQAMSIAMSGISIGGMLLVPISVAIVDRWGLGAATLVLALLVLALVLPMTAFVIRSDPAEMGLGPDGDPRTETKQAIRFTMPPTEWTRSAAMHTRTFWVLVVAFMFGLAAQQAFLLHQLTYLSDRFGGATASTVLSTTAGASIIGRLALGTVSDRLDKRWMAAACFAVQGASMLVVLHTSSLPLIYAATLLFGLTMGNSYIMLSLLGAENFGGASFGAIYGLITLFVTAGSAFGPLLAGVLADASGGYMVPFTIAGLTGLTMAGLVLGARRPNPPAPFPRKEGGVLAGDG
ncbi:MAG: MFS transporter [Dehalococcoidia bacterium]